MIVRSARRPIWRSTFTRKIYRVKSSVFREVTTAGPNCCPKMAPSSSGIVLAPKLVRASLQIRRSQDMNNVIYLVGLVVVIIAILSFFGLR